MKIGIGTVQFGLDYGISNQKGKISKEEVKGILNVATQNGVRIIDTAAIYGNSEEILGKTLPHNHHLSIVTKTPRFSKDYITNDDVRLMEETFLKSLSKLKLSSVYGLLIHHADDLFVVNGHLLMEKMLDIKHRGLVEKIGVSVYTGEQIDRVIDKYPIDLIQVPINVLDQRLLISGHLLQLKKAGIKIHARSVFLQGLLLMEPKAVPSYFNPIREHLLKYREYLQAHDISPLQYALQFVLQQPEIDTVLVGVCSATEVREIVSCVKNISNSWSNYSDWAINDERFLNPTLWRITLYD